MRIGFFIFLIVYSVSVLAHPNFNGYYEGYLCCEGKQYKNYALWVSPDSLYFTCYGEKQWSAAENLEFKKRIARGDAPWKMSVDDTTYIFAPRILKDTEEIRIRISYSSTSDSLTLFQYKRESSTGAVEWEIVSLLTFVQNNGQPAQYTVYYYDTSSVNCSSFPTSIVKFRNGVMSGKEIAFYNSKELMAYKEDIAPNETVCGSICSHSIKLKIKWKHGVETKNKHYQPCKKLMTF
jgi:hypothetical protein